MSVVLVVVVEFMLLVPYFAWGVFALHRRLRRHHESTPLAEGLTLLALLIFFLGQVMLMRSWMRPDGPYYLFSLLGLFIATTALYAHTAVSFFSCLLVELVTYGNHRAPEGPRLEPMLELERRKDYEGALGECRALARAHPKNLELHLRIAENLLRLERPEEAATSLERAIAISGAPEPALPALNRLCEIYEQTLKRPEDACVAIRDYLQRFPAAKAAATLEARLDRLESGPPPEPESSLEPLQVQPISEPEADEEAPPGAPDDEETPSSAWTSPGQPALEPIESPLDPASEAEPPAASDIPWRKHRQSPSPDLIPMDEMPLDDIPQDPE